MLRSSAFGPWGTESLLAEIPPECHTGKHKHGEESIHIVDGTGFSIVNGMRYFFEGAAKEEFPYLFLAFRQGVAERDKERERVRERVR